MQLFGKKMGQMGSADAQRVGNAFQGEILGKMVRNISHDPMAQPVVAVIINRMVGQAVQRAGQKHMQIGNAEGEVLLHIQGMQAADNPQGIRRGIRGAENFVDASTLTEEEELSMDFWYASAGTAMRRRSGNCFLRAENFSTAIWNLRSAE